MRRVYKYHIGIHPNTTLELPLGAKFLKADVQSHEFFLWFEVNLNPITESRTFSVHGTGQDINSPHENWLGTFADGPYVWHVYEEIV